MDRSMVLAEVENWFRERFLREFPEISINSYYCSCGNVFVELSIQNNYPRVTMIEFELKITSIDGHLIDDIKVKDCAGQEINSLEDFYCSMVKNLTTKEKP